MSGSDTGPGSWRLPRRLAYVVSHSRPWSSNGYAVRTDAVARALSEAGHEVIVFTRPGRPWDIEGFPADTNVPLDHRIDGLRHIHLPMPPMPGAKPIARVRMAADILTEAFYAFRPAAVLAASNWENAEPARRAAGRTGAAFFYEQRGFWDMGADAETDAERAERRQETEIALAARAVFTLNGPMRNALVQRGVPEGRIHLVPNGLSFRMRQVKRLTRDMIGCKARYLLGYIGSLSSYEGVEDLLHLTAMLRKGGPAGERLDVAALIVGSDAPKGLLGSVAGTGTAEIPAQASLRRLARELGIADFVHFIPQLPEAEAASHFPLCDAIILPRRRTRVTELVPPVKPYAAAAWSLPVFMTDLPPLAEIAPEINGSLFPQGDIPALAAMVHTALTKGHPAAILPLDPDLDWVQRVRPIHHQLDIVAEAEQSRNARLLGGFGQIASDAAQTGPASPSSVQSPATPRRFDRTILPSVGLQRDIGAAHLALIGPASVRGGLQEGDTRLTVLTRANLLDTLATTEPGRFVIDWAGLQAEADPASDWAGLWSIDDMRLNRQIMDAARIATECGWRVQVIGPVHRSQAPLYRTIATVAEEILPASIEQITAGDVA